MGRRALKKPDPSIDLSPYLKTFDELPSPWDTAALFAGTGPLEVEVGSGKGLFMRTAAAQHPDVNFLGIELSGKYARHSAGALAKRELDNAVMVSSDALRVFNELLPDASLAAVHVYFPDPWWKKRHRRRRVMQEALIRDIQRTLRPGGSLHFWTDVEEYFQTTLELMAQVSTLEGPLEVVETPAEHDMAYRTHFERRTRLDALPVYRAEFRRQA